MAEERDFTNSGILFNNEEKRSDKSPDLTGNINVDGVEYWLSGWRREGKKGKFLSLKIKPKQQQRAESYRDYATDTSKTTTPAPAAEAPKDELGQDEFLPF